MRFCLVNHKTRTLVYCFAFAFVLIAKSYPTTIKGHVIEPSGIVIKEFEIDASPSRRGEPVTTSGFGSFPDRVHSFVGTNSEFELHMDEGDYLVTAISKDPDGFAGYIDDVIVEQGKNIKGLEIKLMPSFSVTGVIKDATTLMPLHNAYVSLMRQIGKGLLYTSKKGRCKTDLDGNFNVTSFGSGPHVIMAGWGLIGVSQVSSMTSVFNIPLSSPTQKLEILLTKPQLSSVAFWPDLPRGYIGIYPSTEKGYIKVIDIKQESPAYKAGIKPDDIIIEINGKDTKNMSIPDFIKESRGLPGTVVKLKFKKISTSKIETVNLTRKLLDTPGSQEKK